MFEVQQWWPTVVFTCKCDVSDPPILALVGPASGVDCPKCRTRYSIDQFEYDRATDKIAISLGQRLTYPGLVRG